MLLSRNILKTTTIGVLGLGTLASLRANDYDIGSIGIVRLGRAAITVFIIGSHYRNTLYKSNLDKTSSEYLELKSKVHTFGAEKLLNLCCTNKGVYIKVGQHLGSLDYLIPKEYIDTLKVLYSAAPESSFKDVLAVIQEDFKTDPYNIFESINPKPLGTASLAQVHKAVLKSGETVAVKIQHKSVKANSYTDIKTMAGLVWITSIVFPEFKFEWLVDETKRNIPQELDFYGEGKNAEKVKNMFSAYQWLKVPKIYWNLTSSRVLTMEFLEGGQVNDLEYLNKYKINPFEISNKLATLYSHMIFINGFVHSDPHPGNILVRKNNRETEVILLDHGLYAQLTDEFRCEYSKLWLAILEGNIPAIKLHSINLGVGDMYGLLACMVSGRSWNAIATGVRKTKYTVHEKELFQKDVPNFLPQISSVLQRVNRQMLLILRMNDLMRGVEYTLKTQQRMSAFLEMSRCCINSIYGDRLNNSVDRWSWWKLIFIQQWALLKLSLYHMYLGITRFDLNQQLETVWSNIYYFF
ncbi:aarF domain-containing kinase 1-like [Prorops nasuta]|uniref:aarF domain-containing kinase 1-like n=1 Tax=Prorops nasuta TaxID=863751 RepID=UPI0034CFD242